MANRIEAATRPDLPDAQGLAVKNRLLGDLGIKIDDVRVAQVYTIDKELGADAIEKLRKDLFTDPLTQESALNAVQRRFDFAIEVGFLPGVTDNAGRTSAEAISDMLGLEFSDNEGVYTSKVYLLTGKLSDDDLKRISGFLHNPLIERVKIKGKDEFERDGGMGIYVPKVHLPPSRSVKTVDLDVDDDELVKLGTEGILDRVEDGREIRRGPLALDMVSLSVIRDYFREEGRHPTDVELESLAQTWSEHCKHTIFAAKIDDIEDGLYKTFIQGATREIEKRRGDGWTVSVFSDNSGVVRFTDEHNICYKVETHNSPSALDPYGGAITGIVGVNRDPLGTGKGSRLAINVYGFCFGDPYYKGEPAYRKPGGENPILHPKVIFEGVRRGVEDGGNKSGIPTAWGFLRFDDRYMGKPLVFVGTVGVMPKTIKGEPSHEKRAMPGDLIVMAGGRVGKDGIHGATFSSESLHAGSPMGAVQIGDPITQKKMGDAQLELRDLGLYNSVTDNGAGGLSCSVGEMARECGGCTVNLDEVPLKYPGLPPDEIWISESQERMTYAVSPEKIDEFMEIFRRRGVEAAVIGRFTDSGRCLVEYNGETVMDVALDFLHNGLPRKELASTWSPPKHPEPDFNPPEDLGKTILKMLGRLNICSKEYVVRQFDHEVQGGAVLKPLAGVGQDVHTDAVVYKPLLDSDKGVALTSCLYPRYGDIDPYWMAAVAIDNAVRALVAVGADPGHIALLDNFCWRSSDESERLGQLKRAAQACYDFAVAYMAPFISGKDSMFNDFKGFDADGNPIKISIPPTLLISSIGIVNDVRNCVTPDFKEAGDCIYVIGVTFPEMGASEYYAMMGEEREGEPCIGMSLPKVRPDASFELYKALGRAIEAGLVSASACAGPGGLAVAIARMSMAGRLGAFVDLRKIPVGAKISRDDFIMFSESAGRIVISVAPENAAKIETMFHGMAIGKIGEVASGAHLTVKGPHSETKLELNDMLSAYKKTLDW